MLWFGLGPTCREHRMDGAQLGVDVIKFAHNFLAIVVSFAERLLSRIRAKFLGLGFEFLAHFAESGQIWLERKPRAL